jgi:hypothetical protein
LYLKIGVEILAVIHTKDKTDQVVLVCQFRPPLGKKVLEFPAGREERGERGAW